MNNFLHSLRLSFNMALHELRHGWRHFWVFLTCLSLGIAVISTVLSLNHRINSSLNREAHSLLGGDAEISLSSIEATPEQLTFFKRFGTVSHVSTLRAMMWIGEQSTLVEVKAVDEAYPLLGKLVLSSNLPLASTLTHSSIAVDPTLLDQFRLKIGQHVMLGQQSYTISTTITREPDRIVQLFSFGPRVMLSHQALKQSGLVGPFSLVKHHYRILLHPQKQVSTFVQTLKKDFPNTPWRIQTDTDGNTVVDTFVNRLTMFLTLAALATLLIGGIGIGSSARSYLEQKSHSIAIFKTLGATRPIILSSFVLLITMLTLIGSLIGLSTTFAITRMLSPLITAWIPVTATGGNFHIPSALLSTWYGLLIVFIFSIPPLLSALAIKPSLLFRNTRSPLPYISSKLLWNSEALFITTLIVTLVFASGDPSFISGAILVALLAFTLFGLCTWLVRFAASRIHVNKPWLRLALSNLHRPGSTTGTVIFAIGISLSVFITLVLTENNFQNRITEVAEKDAPALFLIDIQSDQQHTLAKLLSAHTSNDQFMIYPMIRGRIIKLNDKPVQPDQVKEDVRWAIRGDRGFSFAAKPPANAHIIQGTWWQPDYNGVPLVSIDERFLDGMGLKIGDRITVNILGKEITAIVANARRIDYSTFQINFAMMFSPGVIDTFPKTYLATVVLGHDSQKEVQLVRDLAEHFPTITTIRTAQAIERVKEVMHHIALAMRIAVIVSLLAGVLVLASSLSALLNQRLYDTAILKVLGARRRDILKAYISEWLCLASITTFIASAIGTLGAWLVINRLPGQSFTFLPYTTGIIIICCILFITLIGYVGNAQIFRIRPASLLRNE